MTTFRAHYDGRVIVPDEPVDLPVNEPLELHLKSLGRGEHRNLTLEERLERLEKFAGSISAPAPSEESLRRENMYEE